MDNFSLYDKIRLMRYAEIFDIGEICVKKKLAALLAICMLSVTMTACGGGNAPAETETDENGITWTLLTVTDVYTEQNFEIGFAETEDGQVFIMNTAGSVYEGKYLTADETVVYMGTAVGLLS